MSQPRPRHNETLTLVIALMITVGVFLGIAGWLWRQMGGNMPGAILNGISTNPTIGGKTLQERSSGGDRLLFPLNAGPDKQQASRAIAQGDWQTAINSLQASLRANRNDPEALIALNNAQIGNSDAVAIGVSIPISTDPNGSLEILRGVAQAQEEVNRAGGMAGKRLRVILADDSNQPEVAKQLATLFVQQNVLGVVGPYASDISLAIAPVYQEQRLVAISPISSAVKLSGISPYFFRTVPSDYVAARSLANYALTTLQTQRVAIFFNSASSYSQSLKAEFATALSLGGGQTVAEFDLAAPGFSAAQAVQIATKQGAKALMLAASTNTLDQALQVMQVNQGKLSLLGGDDVYTLKTLEVGGRSAKGLVVAVPWHIAAPSSATFAQSSQALWGATVNWRTAIAYDATQALIAAIRQQPSREGVQQVLRNPGFTAPGASNPVRFLPSGDRDVTVQLVQVVPRPDVARSFDFQPIGP